jgi:hypothetical protein
MAHEVKITKLPELNVAKEDIEFAIWKDGKKLGELHLSQGGLEWYPAHQSQKRSGFRNMDWGVFARVMEAFHNGSLENF